ncbi:hypothetical protein [Rubinisphaera sp.]|uniref:hypothetical protein n=1 Tax=Rubinisphaera sp. TaxID=2024857 RepID=UPI0025CD5288|nr:hypothetical protein [Rubinisphaera sp.]
MRSFLVILTIQTMAIHALFGCCTHHAHAAATLGPCCHEETSHDVHGHDHLNGINDGDSNCEPDHHEQDDQNNCPSSCQEEGCTYISIERTAFADIDPLKSISFADIDLFVAENSDTDCITYGMLKTKLDSLPDLPLRALTQVWLL